MEILVRIAQLLLSLSILVIIHELGHFTFARLFKVRVEKFYLFFNPWFSLFKKKVGDTIYGIGWLPLGGYVKIAGMIDESLDKEALAQPPKPDEYRTKPSWQRFFIMVGGVMFNFIAVIIIYIAVLFAWGEDYLPAKSVMKNGIVPDSLAMSIGFEAGDKILSVDNKNIEQFKQFTDIAISIILDDAKTVTIERNGNQKDINIPDGFVSKMIKSESRLFNPRFPIIIADIPSGSKAKESGLQKGDIIKQIDTVKAEFYDLLSKTLSGYRNQTIPITVEREGILKTFIVQVNENAHIGISIDIYGALPLEHKDVGLFESIPLGIKKGYQTTIDYLKQLKLLFSPKVKAYESVGGFISIGKIFPGVWDWQSFWTLTAFLSIILAVINILPIPALDGGHVLFLLYEIITRRKPSDKFLEHAQIIGMTILILLVIYANGNDIVKLFNPSCS